MPDDDEDDADRVMLSARIPRELKQRVLGLVAAERARNPGATLQSVVVGALVRELGRAKRRGLDVRPMRAGEVA